MTRVSAGLPVYPENRRWTFPSVDASLERHAAPDPEASTTQRRRSTEKKPRPFVIHPLVSQVCPDISESDAGAEDEPVGAALRDPDRARHLVLEPRVQVDRRLRRERAVHDGHAEPKPDDRCNLSQRLTLGARIDRSQSDTDDARLHGED